MAEQTKPDWGEMQTARLPPWTDWVYRALAAVVFLIALPATILSSDDGRPSRIALFWVVVSGLYLLYEPWAARRRSRLRAWISEHPEELRHGPDQEYFAAVDKRARRGVVAGLVLALLLVGLLPVVGADAWLYFFLPLTGFSVLAAVMGLVMPPLVRAVRV